MNKILSVKEKNRIIEDFAHWSGGFTPDQCDYSEIIKYVEYARPADTCESAVLEFLRVIQERGLEDELDNQ